MRPGRLDRILFVGPPDRAGREDILRIRMKAMTVGPDIDVPRLAELASTIFVVVPTRVFCSFFAYLPAGRY